jgi:ribonuclease BN (tRNA processing enzyme)
MRVQFLGSGDAFGSGGRLQACILLDAGTSRLLLDCGASSLIALKRAGVDPNEIDALLISHLHGDHFGGIPFFLLDGQFSKRSRPLVVAGPPGLERRAIEAMEVLFPGSSRASRRFATRFCELAEGEPTAVGEARVTGYEVVHACGAPPYALRVELAGRTIAYSGDTEWTDRLLAATTGADLFIAEAYFYEKPVRFHLDWAALARRREALGAKRLVVTHMGPDMLARVAELPVEAAADGLELTL